MNILILDYGMGNLRSVQSKLKMLGFDSTISSEGSALKTADRIIFPGVGHFGRAMQNLQERKLIDPLNDAVLHKKIPIMGICLGMQLFSSYSEEGSVKGLGWIEAKTFKMDFDASKFRVPHVGWNQIKLKNPAEPFFKTVEPDKRFYFTHSYYVESTGASYEAGITDYGVPFTVVVKKENIFGTQFHPEKSRRYGLQLIDNFLKQVS